MEDSSSTDDAVGKQIPQKLKVAGDDSDGNQPAVKPKKPKTELPRRKSLVRDRRSSRGVVALVYDDDNDLHSSVPLDLPDENRLQIVYQKALTLALNAAFDGLQDTVAAAARANVQASFDEASDELFSQDTIRAAVAQVKRDPKPATEASRELKESLESNKAYVARLKKESEEWDRVRDESEAARPSWRPRDPPAHVTEEQRSFEQRMAGYAELNESLDRKREALMLQMKTIARTANQMRQVGEKAEEDLNRATLKLHLETAGDTCVKDLLDDLNTTDSGST